MLLRFHRYRFTVITEDTTLKQSWSSFICWDKASCTSGIWTSNSNIIEDDLELLILLPPPPRCCDYRHVTTHAFYAMTGIKPRPSCLLDKHSTNWVVAPGPGWILWILISLSCQLFIIPLNPLKIHKMCIPFLHPKVINQDRNNCVCLCVHVYD